MAEHKLPIIDSDGEELRLEVDDLSLLLDIFSNNAPSGEETFCCLWFDKGDLAGDEKDLIPMLFLG